VAAIVRARGRAGTHRQSSPTRATNAFRALRWTERRAARRRRSAARDRSAPRLPLRIHRSRVDELQTAPLPRSLVRAAAPARTAMGVRAG